MRKTPVVAKRWDRAKGGGRENIASRRTTGVTIPAGMIAAGRTMAKSTGTMALTAGTKSERWGFACSTSQQVACTVVMGCE